MKGLTRTKIPGGPFLPLWPGVPGGPGWHSSEYILTSTFIPPPPRPSYEVFNVLETVVQQCQMVSLLLWTTGSIDRFTIVTQISHVHTKPRSRREKKCSDENINSLSGQLYLWHLIYIFLQMLSHIVIWKDPRTTTVSSVSWGTRCS